MAARNEEKAKAAIVQLQTEGISVGSVEWLKLDLSDARFALQAGKEFVEKEKRLDILGVCSLKPYATLTDIFVVNNASGYGPTCAQSSIARVLSVVNDVGQVLVRTSSTRMV